MKAILRSTLKLTAILIVSLVLLGGCQYGGIGRVESPAWQLTATQEQKIAYFRDRCMAYGFRPNTTELAQCIADQSTVSKQVARNKMTAVSQSLIAASNPSSNSVSHSSGGTAFLKSDYVSGLNRICVYDRLGSQYIVTIGSTELCPISQ